MSLPSCSCASHFSGHIALTANEFELQLYTDHAGHRLLKCKQSSLIKDSLLLGPWFIGWRNKTTQKKTKLMSQNETNVSKSVPSVYGIYCQIRYELP